MPYSATFPLLSKYHLSRSQDDPNRREAMATTSFPLTSSSSNAQKMQYFSGSHTSKQTEDSPSYSKRASVVFVNDYAMSSLNNLAPAANDDYSRLERRASEASTRQEENIKALEQAAPKPRASFTSKLGSRFVRKAKEPSLSPPRTRLPIHEISWKANQVEQSAPHTRLQTQTKHRKPSDDDALTAGFSKVKLRDELQVDFPTNRSSVKKSEKVPGKERRKVFQRLSDERVPDECKFKNRKLKSDYIKDKFGASIHEYSTDLSTCATLGGSLSDRRGSFTDFPPVKDNDIDDNFVDGLIFFAPTSESTIRELVQKRSPSA